MRGHNMFARHSRIVLVSAALVVVAALPTLAADREAPKARALQPSMQLVAAQTNVADEPDLYGTGATAVAIESSSQPTAAKRLAVIAPRAVSRGSYPASYPSRSGEPPLILGVRF